MRWHPIKEEPFKSLISREWKRAKRILPQLKKKPWFYWQNSEGLRGSYGRCWRMRNTIGVHHWFRGLTDQKEFVLLLRHEFAHLLTPSDGVSHGKDFIWWNHRLGGTRFVKSSLTEMRKKEAVPPETA